MYSFLGASELEEYNAELKDLTLNGLINEIATITHHIMELQSMDRTPYDEYGKLIEKLVMVNTQLVAEIAEDHPLTIVLDGPACINFIPKGFYPEDL